MKPQGPMRNDLRRVVLERIVRGELRPGDRIKESRLADELGASRTPLREALFSLEREGFVRSELARGFSVEPLSGREVREIYPILWTLEGLALRASVPLVYLLIDELSKLNSRFATNLRPDRAIEADTRWHETLLGSCPNRRLNQWLGALRATVRRYEYVYMRNPTLIAESIRQHQKIIDALMDNDIEAAVQRLTRNWQFGMEMLLVRLGEP
jgi:DNA-binding GntR family transcriptional regulator